MLRGSTHKINCNMNHTTMQESTSKSTVVVIGAGIIGLTSALSIQVALAETHEVVIVAREWPHAVAGAPSGTSADYASMWAGAHVRPVPVPACNAPDAEQLAREARWLKRTCEEFSRQLLHEPELGLTALRGREYLEAPPESYQRQTLESFSRESGLLGYRRLQSAELPEGVKLGYEYNTYCINSPLYCANLLKKFLLRGGKTVARHLANEREGFGICSNVEVVVNASGSGFGDPNCFPVRGQTVLTNLTGITETITRQNHDGTWSFAIPRFFGGGTVIGGTKEPGNWDLDASRSTRMKLLQAAEKLEPGISHKTESGSLHGQRKEPLRVITDIVGRRPTRQGGMRVEYERLDKLHVPATGDHRGSELIIHAYGAGGRGFEISWGVAHEVTMLVRDAIEPNSLTRRTESHKARL